MTSNPNTSAPSAAPSIGGCAVIIAAMAIVFFLGSYSGSPSISKAINLVLVVAMLALGMRYGFAWVTAAADQDPESPTVVATRPDALQAAPLVSKLQQNGINAVATGTHTSGFQVEIASEVKIVVPKQEAAKAMEILGEETTG